MIYHDPDTRSLFARERAELLASEMRAGEQPANLKPSGWRLHSSLALLAQLRRRRRAPQLGKPAYEQ